MSPHLILMIDPHLILTSSSPHPYQSPPHLHLILTQSSPHHQDSGRANVEVEVPDGVAIPRLTLKAGYFLTDLLDSGMGQTWLIPKSHTAHGRQVRSFAHLYLSICSLIPHVYHVYLTSCSVLPQPLLLVFWGAGYCWVAD